MVTKVDGVLPILGHKGIVCVLTINKVHNLVSMILRKVQLYSWEEEVKPEGHTCSSHKPGLLLLEYLDLKMLY